MAGEQLPHLKFDSFYISGEFQSPKSPRSKFSVVNRIREEHGSAIREQFSAAVFEFEEKAKENNQELFNDDFIYLEFESEPGFNFNTDSFDNGFGYYRLSYSKIEKKLIDGEEKEVHKIGIFINKKGISTFLKKIDEYLNPDKDTEQGIPWNTPLLANISEIRSATLECFWTEPKDDFPEERQLVWWEVWIRRENKVSDVQEEKEIKEILIKNEISVGERRILFPEHIIILVRATREQLSNTLLFTDKLAELRSPKELADFFVDDDLEDVDDWVAELNARIQNKSGESDVMVCLLDTGVNRGHPLIQRFLANRNMHTIKPDWGTADDDSGHGTHMAGNVLYGDLRHLLVNQDEIVIYHQLESVKLLNHRDPHDEKLYGAVTIDAASQPVVTNPETKRVYCLAVTSAYSNHLGKPSSWSSALDQIVFGTVDERNIQSLFMVSAGNVFIETTDQYSNLNKESAVEDPSQSFNAITIGAITNLDQIDQGKHPNSRAVATRGALSPFSRTGNLIGKNWANKPDVVFEGGNLGVDARNILEPESLKLLTTNNRYQENPFSTNCATSGATALGSKFAAELYSKYPDLWPESIRGLMIHSSDWNEIMLRGNPMNTVQSKRNVLRTYGYGVPNLEKASFSAEDRLTLIAEREIQPYRKENTNDPKINEYHLFTLPWPDEALRSLFNEEIRLNVTLSYFIEPNPGEKEYSQSYSYSSIGLRFKMCKPNEPVDEFSARINKLARDEDYNGGTSENWFLGPEVRDKGSIHRDWRFTTGPELATKNKIAVFPIGGWWKTRKKLERYNLKAKYSLIISIDAPNIDINVNLYTPVKNQIEIPIQV